MGKFMCGLFGHREKDIIELEEYTWTHAVFPIKVKCTRCDKHGTRKYARFGGDPAIYKWS